MNRRRIAALAGSVLLVFNTALAQKLYKHVDANGVVTYTDIPDKPKDQPMSVGNTRRNGDNTERQNANLTRMANESQQEYELRLQSQRRATQRQQAQNGQSSDVERIPGPVYRPVQSVPAPSSRDSTRD
jgi:hypothetical protein